MGYAQGFQQGRETVKDKNPFAVLLNTIDEKFAERRALDKKKAEEERELRNSIFKLGVENEYETTLMKATEEEKRKTKTIETETEMTGAGKLLGTMGMSGEKGGGLPEGVSLKAGPLTFTGKQTAEEKGEEAAIKEAFERAQGVKRATKRLASIVNQFNKALPAEQKGTTTVSQRVSGITAVLGAKTGLKPNPDLLALQDTAKLQLRGILRDMGEGARMSDQDITQNLAVIEQAGLSNEERKAKIRTFMQVAVDSMDSAIIDTLKKDKTTLDLLSDFGVTLPSENGQEDTEYQMYLKSIEQ